MEIRERLSVLVAHDEAGIVRLVERPRRREAARRGEDIRLGCGLYFER
jgi:hypothetical protein